MLSFLPYNCSSSSLLSYCLCHQELLSQQPRAAWSEADGLQQHLYLDALDSADKNIK